MTAAPLLVALFLTGPAPAGPVTAPPPRGDDALAAVVKKTIDAYGGEQALKKVVAVRETGKVASTIRQGASGTLVRTFARPDRLRVEIGYPNEPVEVRVLDGAKGWRRGAPSQGPALVAMTLQAARLAMPLLLLEKKGQLRDGGWVERDGAKLRALEVPLADGVTLTALVDPGTGHVLHTSSRAQTGMGAIEFASTYSDFRKVNGVLVAFHERTMAMGQYTGDTTLEKVEHLPAAPKEAFLP